MESRICKAVRKVSVCCKEQKALCVRVQASGCVDFLKGIFPGVVKVFFRNKAVDGFVKPAVLRGANSSGLLVHHKVDVRRKIFPFPVYENFISLRIYSESAFKNSCSVDAYIVLLQEPADSSVRADSPADKNSVQPFLENFHLCESIYLRLQKINFACFLMLKKILGGPSAGGCFFTFF